MPRLTPKDLERLTKQGLQVTGLGKGSKKKQERKAKAEVNGKQARPEGGWVIEIKGEVPSSKNSREFVILKDKWGNPLKDPNTGKFKTRLLPSKATQKYKEVAGPQYEVNRAKFQAIMHGKPKPYQIFYKILRFRNDVWDYHNAVQIIADMMVEHKWLEDDDRANAIFYPIPYTLVSTPEEAGVVLIF